MLFYKPVYVPKENTGGLHHRPWEDTFYRAALFSVTYFAIATMSIAPRKYHCWLFIGFGLLASVILGAENMYQNIFIWQNRYRLAVAMMTQ
jgi:hypothetical protein